MERRLDVRRIVIFILIAFGVAWATALVIYQTGGLINSPRLGPGLTLAFLLLATIYMWSPALGNIVTRLLTREVNAPLYLRPELRRGWPYWLLCWFAPGILTILGMALFFAIWPQYYDPSLSQYRSLLEQAAPGSPLPSNMWTLALTQIAVGLAIAPPVNAIATFGEEFGWRAYLLPKLMPLGMRPALLVSGIIWGIWHWPIIVMGYEYGFGYTGFPWTGMFLFLVFTVAFGVLLGWATLRSGSVWPAVIGHGAVNGIAQVFALFLRGQPNPLLGPAVNGLVGVVPFVILAALLLLWPRLTAAARPVQQSV